MSMHLARYLKDFSVQQTAPLGMPGADLGLADDGALDTAFPALCEPDPVDLESERREAYAEGHEAATRELEERYAAERAELESAHAEKIAELIARQEADTAKAVSDGLARLAAQLSMAVSEEVAVALAPFFSEEIAEKAVGELARMLEAAILGGEAGPIVVKGPSSLFELLQQQLPDGGDNIRHIEANDLDLSAEFGESVLVTRISAWTASLKKVMG